LCRRKGYGRIGVLTQDLVTTQAPAARYQLTAQRIRQLAGAGRITHAYRFGKTWIFGAEATIIPARRGPRRGRAVAGDREITMDWLQAEALPRIIARFNPRRIILFGSFAWGEPSTSSDIDICVLLDGRGEKMDFFRTSAAIEASIPRGAHRVEVIAYTLKQIERARRLPFFERILREGKVLHARQ